MAEQQDAAPQPNPPENSQVTFVFREQNLSFFVDKANLAERCRYFENLFNAEPNKQEFPISYTSPEAFQFFLDYINDNTIPLPTNDQLVVQVLALALEYSDTNLESRAFTAIRNNLNVMNVAFFTTEATFYKLERLLNACHSFIDENALAFLSSDTIKDLNTESLKKILKRESFSAPEIDVFKGIVKWSESGNRELLAGDIVSECVQLSLFTLPEILFTVRRSKVVEPKKLLEIIAEISSGKHDSTRLLRRTVKIPNENFATVENEAIVKTFSEEATNNLFNDQTGARNTMEHPIDGESHILIRLGKLQLINHIRMRLCDVDERYFSYYIEVSSDQSEWYRIIDYTEYACRSIQQLYFNKKIVQYIKIVGTSNSKQGKFQLVFFETFYKSEIPEIQNGVIRPKENVAISENNPMVLQGDFWYHVYHDNYEKIARHEIQDERGFIIQLAQPYLVSTMQFALDIKRHDKYRYRVYTSINKIDWEILADKTYSDHGHWQFLHFSERTVVFIKMVGTQSLAQETSTPEQREEQPFKFICDIFQCPAEKKEGANEPGSESSE